MGCQSTLIQKHITEDELYRPNTESDNFPGKLGASHPSYNLQRAGAN